MSIRSQLRYYWEQWKDVIFTTWADGAVMGLNIVSGVLTARLLLPEGKGELTAVQLWEGIFEMVGSLGIVKALVYFAGQYEDDVGRVVGTAMMMAVVQGGIIMASGYLSIGYILDSYDENIVSVAQFYFLCTPLLVMAGYMDRIVQGLGYFRTWNSFRVGKAAIYSGAIVLLWLLEIVTVRHVIYGFVAAEIVVLVAATALLMQVTQRITIDLSLIPQFLSYGLRNWLAGMVGRANKDIDQAIISTILAADQLGLYRIAVSATRMVGVVSTGFKHVLFSEVSRTKGRQKGREQILRYVRIASVLLVLAAGTAVIAMPYILPFFFGEEYTSAVPAAQILCLGAVVLGIYQILTNGVQGQGHPEIPLYGGIGGVVVTAVGLYVLLPLLGIEGAAITSVLAYGTGAVIVYVVGFRMRAE